MLRRPDQPFAKLIRSSQKRRSECDRLRSDNNPKRRGFRCKSRASHSGGRYWRFERGACPSAFWLSCFCLEQARKLGEIGAGVTITPNAMHALNFLGVGERIAKEAGSTEPYLIRHFRTGEVIKVRASGTDYVERFWRCLSPGSSCRSTRHAR